MTPIDQALELVRGLGPKLNEAGFGIAIAGSVLLKGESKKDLDLIVFPQNAGNFNTDRAREVFTEQDWKCLFQRHEVVQFWAKQGFVQDSKFVEVWRASNKKRIDVFFLS